MVDVPVKSVRKALDLLNVLAFEDPESRGVALADLARRGEMPVTSAHNLLTTLVACGYAELVERGRYTTGAVCREMGRRNALVTPAVAALFDQALDELATAIDESMVIAALLDGRRVTLRHRHADHAVVVSRKLVTQDDAIWTTATGRLLWAYADEDARTRVLERNGLPGDLWRDAPDAKALVKVGHQIRAARGYIMPADHRSLAVGACPLLAPDGELLASWGFYAPRERCDEQRLGAWMEQLREASDALAPRLAARLGQGVER